VVRSYNSFHEASVDNSNSRVWVGVHFRRAVDGGQRMGDKIGQQICRQFLRRADGGDDDEDDQDD
jgi:hypothetical protein